MSGPPIKENREGIAGFFDSRKFEWGLVCVLFVAALSLNIWNNHFQFGYHVDEPKKVRFIQQDKQDFHHPLLMLQVVRVANHFLGWKDNQDLVELGRTSSAVFGALIVVLSYCIFRKGIGKWYAAIGALAVATCPILVVHAHYFKEDIIYTCFVLWALLAFIRFFYVPGVLNTVFLGTATGLAVSSQYKGFLLVLFYLFIPLVVRPQAVRRYYGWLLGMIPVMLGIFLVVNYPLFSNFEIFKSAVIFDKSHVLNGHDVKVYGPQMLFLFHLLYSIGPWMGWGLTVLSLFAIGVTVRQWKTVSVQDKILVVYALLFYFVFEWTPLKSFPDYTRYVTSIIPVLIYFSVRGMLLLINAARSRRLIFAVSVLVVFVLIMPVYASIQLVYHLDKDTREQAKTWMVQSPHKVMCEQYIFTYHIVQSLSDKDVTQWQNAGFEFLVASSFLYDRYFFGSQLKGQDTKIYQAQERYKALFDYPYTEIRPAYRSYAFSNPTVRIIDIRSVKK